METGAELCLQYWADPQGDSVVIYSAKECLVFRGCWTESGEPADYVSCLSFYQVKGIRCYPREFGPYVHIERCHRSGVLCLSDTEMIKEYRAYRERHDPNSKGNASEVRHYVVEGHDFYHEILATGFTETAIPVDEIADDRLRRLLDEA